MEILLLGKGGEDEGGKLRKTKRYPTHSPQGAGETIQRNKRMERERMTPNFMHGMT